MNVVVTGSSSGFGRAIVEGFARRGDTVIATVRRPEDNQDLVREATGQRGAVHLVQLDVADDASRHAAVAQILGEHGQIDVLVNNAGMIYIGSVEDTPSEVNERIFATNYFGPVELTRLVLPAMRASGAGRVVNVTAIGAVLCTPFLSSYCATKHALDATSCALDLEVRPFGIRVSSVLPGAFRTEIIGKMPEGSDSDAYAASTGDFRDGLQQRIASASDDLSAVVDAVVDAATSASPEARYQVGGPDYLAPMVEILNDAHAKEAARLGL